MRKNGTLIDGPTTERSALAAGDRSRPPRSAPFDSATSGASGAPYGIRKVPIGNSLRGSLRAHAFLSGGRVGVSLATRHVAPATGKPCRTGRTFSWKRARGRS